MRLVDSEAGNATMSPAAGLTFLHNRRIPSKCFVIGALHKVSHYGRGMVVGFEICVCAVSYMLPDCHTVSSHTYTSRRCHAPSRGYDAVAQPRPSVPCCIQATDWHWWGNSKRKCTEAVRNSDPELGATTCCYGWIDIAFFPRHMHTAFVRGTVSFWEAAYTWL